jgi:hypothetical protein
MDEQLSAADWQACIDNVLFPLMDALLRPPLQGAQVRSLEEIRIRTLALLSKVFLQHVAALSRLEGFPMLWMRLLAYMERFKNAGAELAEAVPESLKNMLLVMSTHGILTAPPSGKASQQSLWTHTWNRIEAFLPGMCAEVFPSVQPPEQSDGDPHVSGSSALPTGAGHVQSRASLQVGAHPFGDAMSPIRALSAPGRVGPLGTVPVMSTPAGGTVSQPGTPAALFGAPPLWQEGTPQQQGGGGTARTPQQGAVSPNPKLQLHATPITI